MGCGGVLDDQIGDPASCLPSPKPAKPPPQAMQPRGDTVAATALTSRPSSSSQPPSAAPFDTINVEELTQLTTQIGDQNHPNYQQQQRFQRAFQRLVTELERMYKHQLFNILQELGVSSHLVHGEEINGEALQLGDNMRKKLAQLQAYTKENCDALIQAVETHDGVLGTALKQSLLPILVTAKCFEDGVINRLLHFSRPQLEMPPGRSSAESQFEDHTPALASDWSLSTNSTPGCRSPAPKSDGSGLTGPPSAKRPKLKHSREPSKLPEFEKLLPPKLPQTDRVTPIKMEAQQAGPGSCSSDNNEILSAFRYLGKQGNRSSIFSSSNKLPDHGLKLSHKGIHIENTFIASPSARPTGMGRTSLSASYPSPELHANARLTSQVMSPAYNLHAGTQALTANGIIHAVTGNNGTAVLAPTNIQIPFQTVPPPVSSMNGISQYMLPAHALLGHDRYDPLLNLDNHVSMSMDLMASVTSGWKHGRVVGHSPSKRKKKFKGIRKTASGKWVARIEHNGKQKHLGTFPTLEEAATTYDQALYQILSITRPKKINLKRFNFPDNICSTYGIAENGVLRVCKKEMDQSVVRSMPHGHHIMPMPHGPSMDHRTLRGAPLLE